MDHQNDPTTSNPNLFSDPFAATSFPLTTSTANTPVVNTAIANVNTNNHFALASPSPSTAGRGFNPDDFLVSPPQPSSQATPIESHRTTPELKRRLFGPPDVGPHQTPGIIAGSTPRQSVNNSSRLQSTLRFSTPPDRVPSPLISFSLSPQESFLPDALPVNGSTSRSTPMPVLSTGMDHPILDPLPSPSQCGPGLPKGNVCLQQSPPSPTSGPPFPFVQAVNFHTKGDTHISDDIEIDCPTGDTVRPGPELDKESGIDSQLLSQEIGEPEMTGAIVLKPSILPDPTLSHLPTTPFTPDSGSEKFKCCCKASKCLKLYCICFAKSGYCNEGCSCKNCLNTQETHNAVREARDTVLARDPRAFDPKVRLSVRSTAGTPAASDIHAKGCNCRKGCSKKYCVCRELRVECGPRCTCSGPKGCLNRRLSTRGERLSLVTPGSSTSTGQASPMKISVQTPNSHHRVGVPAIELPPSGYTSIIADQLKGQRGKNKGKIRPRVRKRDREQGKDKNDDTEIGSAKGAKFKRQKFDLMSDEDASMGLGALLENTLNGLDGREGPVHELDPVGLDIDKSPTVGLNDDVEKFREVTDGFIGNVGFGGATVGGQVMEQVLAKVGDNTPIIDMESIGQTKTEKGSAELSVQNGDDTINARTRNRVKKKERNSDGRRESGYGIFGRESEGIDICRIPRILRVKMGSGRLLNKFGL